MAGKEADNFYVPTKESIPKGPTNIGCIPPKKRFRWPFNQPVTASSFEDSHSGDGLKVAEDFPSAIDAEKPSSLIASAANPLNIGANGTVVCPASSLSLGTLAQEPIPSSQSLDSVSKDGDILTNATEATCRVSFTNHISEPITVSSITCTSVTESSHTISSAKELDATSSSACVRPSTTVSEAKPTQPHANDPPDKEQPVPAESLNRSVPIKFAMKKRLSNVDGVNYWSRFGAASVNLLLDGVPDGLKSQLEAGTVVAGVSSDNLVNDNSAENHTILKTVPSEQHSGLPGGFLKVCRKKKIYNSTPMVNVNLPPRYLPIIRHMPSPRHPSSGMVITNKYSGGVVKRKRTPQWMPTKIKPPVRHSARLRNKKAAKSYLSKVLASPSKDSPQKGESVPGENKAVPEKDGGTDKQHSQSEEVTGDNIAEMCTAKPKQCEKAKAGTDSIVQRTAKGAADALPKVKIICDPSASKARIVSESSSTKTKVASDTPVTCVKTASEASAVNSDDSTADAVTAECSVVLTPNLKNCEISIPKSKTNSEKSGKKVRIINDKKVSSDESVKKSSSGSSDCSKNIEVVSKKSKPVSSDEREKGEEVTVVVAISSQDVAAAEEKIPHAESQNEVDVKSVEKEPAVDDKTSCESAAEIACEASSALTEDDSSQDHLVISDVRSLSTENCVSEAEIVVQSASSKGTSEKCSKDENTAEAVSNTCKPDGVKLKSSHMKKGKRKHRKHVQSEKNMHTALALSTLENSILDEPIKKKAPKVVLYNGGGGNQWKCSLSDKQLLKDCKVVLDKLPEKIDHPAPVNNVLNDDDDVIIVSDGTDLPESESIGDCISKPALQDDDYDSDPDKLVIDTGDDVIAQTEPVLHVPEPKKRPHPSPRSKKPKLKRRKHLTANKPDVISSAPSLSTSDQKQDLTETPVTAVHEPESSVPETNCVEEKVTFSESKNDVSVPDELSSKCSVDEPNNESRSAPEFVTETQTDDNTCESHLKAVKCNKAKLVVEVEPLDVNMTLPKAEAVQNERTDKTVSLKKESTKEVSKSTSRTKTEHHAISIPGGKNLKIKICQMTLVDKEVDLSVPQVANNIFSCQCLPRNKDCQLSSCKSSTLEGNDLNGEITTHKEEEPEKSKAPPCESDIQVSPSDDVTDKEAEEKSESSSKVETEITVVDDDGPKTPSKTTEPPNTSPVVQRLGDGVSFSLKINSETVSRTKKKKKTSHCNSKTKHKKVQPVDDKNSSHRSPTEHSGVDAHADHVTRETSSKRIPAEHEFMAEQSSKERLVCKLRSNSVELKQGAEIKPVKIKKKSHAPSTQTDRSCQEKSDMLSLLEKHLVNTSKNSPNDVCKKACKVSKRKKHFKVPIPKPKVQNKSESVGRPPPSDDWKKAVMDQIKQFSQELHSKPDSNEAEINIEPIQLDSKSPSCPSPRMEVEEKTSNCSSPRNENMIEDGLVKPLDSSDETYNSNMKKETSGSVLMNLLTDSSVGKPTKPITICEGLLTDVKEKSVENNFAHPRRRSCGPPNYANEVANWMSDISDDDDGVYGKLAIVRKKNAGESMMQSPKRTCLQDVSLPKNSAKSRSSQGSDARQTLMPMQEGNFAVPISPAPHSLPAGMPDKSAPKLPLPCTGDAKVAKKPYETMADSMIPCSVVVPSVEMEEPKQQTPSNLSSSEHSEWECELIGVPGKNLVPSPSGPVVSSNYPSDKAERKPGTGRKRGRKRKEAELPVENACHSRGGFETGQKLDMYEFDHAEERIPAVAPTAHAVHPTNVFQTAHVAGPLMNAYVPNNSFYGAESRGRKQGVRGRGRGAKRGARGSGNRKKFSFEGKEDPTYMPVAARRGRGRGKSVLSKLTEKADEDDDNDEDDDDLQQHDEDEGEESSSSTSIARHSPQIFRPPTFPQVGLGDVDDEENEEDMFAQTHAGTAVDKQFEVNQVSDEAFNARLFALYRHDRFKTRNKAKLRQIVDFQNTDWLERSASESVRSGYDSKDDSCSVVSSDAVDRHSDTKKSRKNKTRRRREKHRKRDHSRSPRDSPSPTAHIKLKIKLPKKPESPLVTTETYEIASSVPPSPPGLIANAPYTDGIEPISDDDEPPCLSPIQMPQLHHSEPPLLQRATQLPYEDYFNQECPVLQQETSSHNNSISYENTPDHCTRSDVSVPSLIRSESESIGNHTAHLRVANKLSSHRTHLQNVSSSDESDSGESRTSHGELSYQDTSQDRNLKELYERSKKCKRKSSNNSSHFAEDRAEVKRSIYAPIQSPISSEDSDEGEYYSTRNMALVEDSAYNSDVNHSFSSSMKDNDGTLSEAPSSVDTGNHSTPSYESQIHSQSFELDMCWGIEGLIREALMSSLSSESEENFIHHANSRFIDLEKLIQGTRTLFADIKEQSEKETLCEQLVRPEAALCVKPKLEDDDYGGLSPPQPVPVLNQTEDAVFKAPFAVLDNNKTGKRLSRRRKSLGSKSPCAYPPGYCNYVSFSFAEDNAMDKLIGQPSSRSNGQDGDEDLEEGTCDDCDVENGIDNMLLGRRRRMDSHRYIGLTKDADECESIWSNVDTAIDLSW